MIGLCVTFAVAMLAGEPVAPRSLGHLGTWVWDQATVTSDAGRSDLLAFARRKGIDLLFVHATAAYETPGGFAALAALAEGASRAGASVVTVAGDPAWAQPEHQAVALGAVQRAARLDQRLAARGLPRSGRILFDVEPYLLPGWRAAPDRAAAEYDRLLPALRRAAHEAGLQVWHTIPFWYRTMTVAGQSLEDRVLAASDGVVVMAYRNRAEDVQAVAAPVVDRGARQGRPVLVAVETTCVDPPQVSFCGRSGGELARALDRVASGLRGSPAFVGLAVHSYPGWVRLDGAGR
ncbi:MAG TPA: hypothetical protein VHH90_04400 [Polyangia bacterium]|nr:hypothetical protein [Polyangia bacterium]